MVVRPVVACEFPTDDASFTCCAPPVFAEDTIFSDHTVTRNKVRNRIRSHCGPYGLHCPRVKREDIRCIESHPMAIRQCPEFIHSLSGVEVRESDDTALSAKRVKELKLKDTAAIANEFAAKKIRTRHPRKADRNS